MDVHHACLCKTLVYHSQGQTGRFTVWLNGAQNSGLVNFVPESRLPFFLQANLAVTICINQFHLPKNSRRPRKPENGIKNGFEEMEQEFPFGTFQTGKKD